MSKKNINSHGFQIAANVPLLAIKCYLIHIENLMYSITIGRFILMLYQTLLQVCIIEQGLPPKQVISSSFDILFILSLLPFSIFPWFYPLAGPGVCYVPVPHHLIIRMLGPCLWLPDRMLCPFLLPVLELATRTITQWLIKMPGNIICSKIGEAAACI